MIITPKIKNQAGFLDGETILTNSNAIIQEKRPTHHDMSINPITISATQDNDAKIVITAITIELAKNSGTSNIRLLFIPARSGSRTKADWISALPKQKII